MLSRRKEPLWRPDLAQCLITSCPACLLQAEDFIGKDVRSGAGRRVWSLLLAPRLLGLQWTW